MAQANSGRDQNSAARAPVDSQRGVMGAYAYEALRAAIVSGTYPADSRLKEAELAAHLSMSRTPIREAIRQLELDGLVSLVPNRGAVVRGTTAQDIQEIFALRAVLEGFSASEAAQRMQPDEIAALASNQAELQALAEGETDDVVARIMELNRSFHHSVLRGSRNARLVALHHKVTELPLQWRIDFWSALPARRAAVMYHNEIVEAIRARDPLRADAVMKSHMYAAKDYFARQLRRPAEDEIAAGGASPRSVESW